MLFLRLNCAAGAAITTASMFQNIKRTALALVLIALVAVSIYSRATNAYRQCSQ